MGKLKFYSGKTRAFLVFLLVILLITTISVIFINRDRTKELTIIFPEMSQAQKHFITPLVTAFELQSRYDISYEFRNIADLNRDLYTGNLNADLYYSVNNYQIAQLKQSGFLSEIKLRKIENVPDLFLTDKYFVPISWYPWGIYYNKTVFNELNLSIPATRGDFIKLCETIVAEGYYPISLMTKIKWPSTIWFDYFNVLLNGEIFHRQLLSGEIPFTDDRVKAVFIEVLNLHRSGFVYTDSDSFQWQAMINAMDEGRVLMHLTGSFFYENAPDSLKRDLGWFPFPEVKTLVASSSGFVIPVNSKNHRGALNFLEYVLSEEGQRVIQRNSDFIAVHSVVSEDLSREDLPMAVSSLNNYNSIIPSFERNTHKDLIIPIKNAVNSLYSMTDITELDSMLEKLEEYRQNM